MPLSKGVTLVFSSLGTSKKWTGNTSITFFISQNTHIQWHVSKNFKVNQQLFWWLPDWLVSCVELQELKFGGFSYLKFQNFPGEDPRTPLSFCRTNAKYLPAPLVWRTFLTPHAWSTREVCKWHLSEVEFIQNWRWRRCQNVFALFLWIISTSLLRHLKTSLHHLEKWLEKSGLKSYTDSPNRTEALRLIDSAKPPFCASDLSG